MRINTYIITEHAHESKFKLTVQAPPPLLGEITSSTVGTVTVNTTMQGLPAAHGYSVGQVVRLCKPSQDSFEIEGGVTLYALDIAGSRGVVTQVYEDSRIATIAVYTGAWALDNSQRQVLTIRVASEPHNYIFSPAVANSIGYERIGFDAKAYQHRLDGLQTFTAPNVFNLEGPDYVLIYISDGKRNTNMIHQSLDEVSCPFAKVILYPGYREERALTSELLLSSGEDFSRFTIAVRNPDGSPYQTNGATWSFTLNFVVQG